MKNILRYLQGIPGIVLILYVQLILSADIYLSELKSATKTWLYVLAFVGAVILCPALIRLFRRFSIRYKATLTNKRRKIIWFTAFWLISAAIFGFYYVAEYPGAFSADSITQYKQAITGVYNNWHPVLHTLLGFKLPLTLTGGWVGSIVLFQLIVFSLAAAYAAYTILRHSNIPFAALSLAFILISPATAVMSLYPWKDIPFAIMALLAVSYAANTYFTKGEWLKKRSHIVAVVIVLVLATVFRHNAILFTLPMLIAMLLYLKRKAVLIIAACFAAAVILIEGPLYAMLHVEQPGDRQTEMLGVPVSVIGAVAARNPSALDAESRQFIYSVAPAQSWTNGYVIGNFNTVKFLPGTNYHKISEAGAPKVIGCMFKCFIRSPKEAFAGFIAATDMVYTVTGDDSYWSDVTPGIVGNEYNISYRGDRVAKDVISFTSNRLNTFMKWFFWYVGAMNLLLITAALARFKFNQKAEWKRILPVLAMLMYNFGTMLLLSGDDFRLFYYTFPITPVLLLLILREEDNTSTADKKAAIEPEKARFDDAPALPVEEQPDEAPVIEPQAKAAEI